MIQTPFPRRSKFRLFLRYFAIPLLISLFALGPLLGAFLADAVSRAFQCHASEAGGGVCIVGGVDFGSELDALMAAGWLALVTLPLGALLLAAYLLYLLISGILRRRKLSAKARIEA